VRSAPWRAQGARARHGELGHPGWVFRDM